MRAFPECVSSVCKILSRAALCLLAAGSVSAQTVTEFNLTPGAHVRGVKSGSDGNIWAFYYDAGKISRLTTTGVVTDFTAGISGGHVYDAALGPDGNLWFTEPDGYIAKITPAGVVTEYALAGGSGPTGIVAGPDGNMWFSEAGRNNIGRITMAGVVTEFPITAGSWAAYIVVGPDGNLWFAEADGNRIGRITTAGVVTEFSAGITAGAAPVGIAVGSDGNLWFSERNFGQIGRITTAGVVTEFSAGTGTDSLAADSTGNLWFLSGDTIGRITTTGVVTNYTAAMTGITPGRSPFIINLGSDNNLWFSEPSGPAVGRLTNGPSVPVIGTATGNSSQATVTFTAPAFNGGSAITGYTVTSNPAGGVDSNAGTTGLNHVITGLVNGTPYTFTVTATNANGTSAASAASNSVTPSATVPTATTGAAGSITSTGAILNGTINDNGASTAVTFDYGLTAGYGSNVAATTGATVAANAGSTAVAKTLTGLTCNTTYHFRVNGVNSAGTTNGGDVSFVTSACPTYTVTYNGNTNTGGSVPVDAATYLSGATVTTLGNTGPLIKTNYAFAGWNTAANGSGMSQAGASTFTMGAANVSLYAQWTLASINGVCGSSNGTTVAFAPTANLCSAGNASSVTTGSGTYGWSCAGSNGGTTATCSANGQSTGGAGAGTATVTTNGWGFAAQGNGPLQSAGFIPASGHPKSPPNLPPGVSFPWGLYDFVLNAGTVGSSAVITITYPGAIPAGAVYWKYGPTPAGYNCTGAACATPHWYQFPAVTAGNTATLTIVDGGVGDDDLVANGTIVDQGGPGLGIVEVPTLSEWARILLAGMLAMFGMLAVRRKNR